MGRRVLLVGRIPDATGRRTGFPELRTDAFRHALDQAGHDVRLAGLVPLSEASDALPSAWKGTVRVAEEGPDWLGALRRAAQGAELLIAAGPHNASRAACLIAGERPVWADLPGDPFAEVQAAALATETALPERQAAAAAAVLPVLARADRFGAVSHRQRLLLLGQLGLVGRLAQPDSSDLVDVVPVSWHFDLPPKPPRARQAGSPLRIALVGGANAWLDVAGLCAGLDAAHSRVPSLSVLLSGGPVEGHHTAGWHSLLAWATARSWVVLRPRLPPAALEQALSGAHVGVVMDRPGLEPETGSRTRVLFLLHQGLEVVTTTRTELCEQLAQADLVHPVPCGSPAALADALVALQAGDSGARAASAAAVLPDLLGALRTVGPVVAFADEPRRSTPVPHPFADLAADHARLRDQLTRVHATPTWRLLARLHGSLNKRR